MREAVEFRIPERNAQGRLPDETGDRLGGGEVRRVLVSTDDPLFADIRRLDREFRERGDIFFYGWIPHRHYTRKELEGAELLHAWPRKEFEPAGEECGTVYDESLACGHVFDPAKASRIGGWPTTLPASTCGVGARQVSPLCLDARRIPRRLDFSQTIAGEIVASSRAREIFLAAELTGVEFMPLWQSNLDGKPSSGYFQFVVVGPPIELDGSTRAGGSLFDESGHGRCPHGHIIGLNLLSEVHVRRETLGAADILATKQLVGVRRGLLRPRPMLLLSPKAWRVITSAKLKGLGIEVAQVQ